MAAKLQFKIEAINKQFNDALEESKKRTENLEKNLGAVAKASSIAFAGLGAAIGGAVREAAKIEDISTQFEVLTGSVLGANKAVKQLQEFSASTPFSFEQVAGAGKQLLAFGFSVEQITEKLQEVGDVAAASGKDVGELTTIYGQVAAAGKLTGERLNQLQEAAVPIGPVLAETLGVAEKSVRDLVSKGAVDFETFEKAFRKLSQEGGFAFGGLEKASLTLSGKISTLKDNISLVASEIGARFLPAAKGATDGLLAFFQQLRNNPELLDTAANILKIAAISTGAIAAITGLAFAFVKLKAALSATVVLFKVAGVALAALVSPIGLTVAAIGGLAAAVTALAAGWDENLSFVENFTQNFAKRIGTLFSGLSNIIKAAFDLDTAGIKSGFEEIKAAFAKNVAEMESMKDEVARKRAERIEKEKQDNAERLAALEQQEMEAQALREEREAERRQKEKEDKLAQAEEERIINEEIALLEQEQKMQFNEQEKEMLREHLASQQSLKIQDAKQDLDRRRKTRQQEMKIEQEFGKNYLKLHKTINSEEFKNAQTLAAQNINLARSENSAISTIGKAAAITQITTDAAKGAMGVFAQAVRTFPPPFGPAIGGALAAAQIAYGAERVRQVSAAQQGGLVEGIGPGDTNPFMLERGELVVPRQNFEDVVRDAAIRQNQEDGEGRSNGGLMEVIVGFRDDAFEIIEQKILERRETGVGVL